MRVSHILLACALAACGSDDGGDAPARDAASAGDAAGSDLPSGRADILVSQRSIEGASIDTGISAVWYLSPPPDPYTVVSESGPCVLTETAPTGCVDPCDGVCIDATCQPFPSPVAAGRLTVTGGAERVEIDPVDGGYAYYQPTPLFAPGDQVEIAAAGDALEAFTVAAAAVADLVAPGTDDLALVPGEDFAVSWQPADAASWVRLRLESNQHGQFSPTVVECTVPDGAGGITVPGSMIERFWATPGQCGECPVQSLARIRRATATAGDHAILLEYGSSISFYPYP